MIPSKKDRIIEFLQKHPEATDASISNYLTANGPQVTLSYVKRVREEYTTLPPTNKTTEIERRTHPWVKILIGCLIAFIVVCMKTCNDRKLQLSSLSNQINEANYQSKIWKDKYGKEHITVQQISLLKEDIKRKFDSVGRLLKIKPKQIITVTEGQTQFVFQKELRIDTVWSGDSILSKILEFEDNYIKVKASFFEEDGNIEVSGSDTLKYVEYWKRRWFLGEKRYYIDLTNKSPYIKFTGLKSYTLNKAKPKFLIAPSVGLGYLINGKVLPYIGVSGVYYPISLKFY